MSNNKKMRNNNYILLVDDDTSTCNTITLSLKNTENILPIKAVHNSTDAIEQIKKHIPTAIILDLNLIGSELDGLGLLSVIREHFFNLPVIILTGHGNNESVQAAEKLNIFAFIEKPFYPNQLALNLKRALEFASLAQENESYKRNNIFLENIIGNSRILINTYNEIELSARQKHKAILLLGQVGSGKKTFAKHIHKIKCPNSQFISFQILPDESKESVYNKMLGNTKNKNNISIFDKSEKSTLYIENIELLSIEIQNILYSFLLTDKINEQKYTINLILSSTCTIEELEERCKQQSFSYMLFDALKISTFEIPNLSERKEDIPSIVNYLCEKFFKLKNHKRTQVRFNNEALKLLSSLTWNKSNINELQTFVHWLLNVYIDKEVITSEDISNKLNSTSVQNMSNLLANPIFNKIFVTPKSMKQARMIFERVFITIKCHEYGFSVKSTAENIEMERSALHRKIKTLKIHDYYKNKSLLSKDNFIEAILDIPIDTNAADEEEKNNTDDKKKIKTHNEDTSDANYIYTPPSR